MGYIPTSGKAELHITYRCNLTCTACTRESFLARPHTPDMTIEDLQEFFRQADAVGWRNVPGPGGEKPRLIIIGGEPTLHPQFLEFVDLSQKWSGTYVQVYSNSTTQKSKELLAQANAIGASIANSAFKTVSIRSEKDLIGEGWWSLTTCVSPIDAGVGPFGKCFAHCSEICGFAIDHNGYSPCAIGHSASTVLGLGATTKNLADLWDEEKNKAMTLAQCNHCGWNIRGRYGKPEDVEAFEKYAMQLPKLKSETLVSPTWEKALSRLE